MSANEHESAGPLTRLVTLPETAAMLRLSPHTVRSFVRKGKLHPVRICRRLLFRPGDIEQLIASGDTNRMDVPALEPRP